MSKAEKYKLIKCGNKDCNKINSGIDKCIQPLVSALNDAGIKTVASCCGHGYQPTSIALEDDMWLVIVSRQEWKKICSRRPDIHGKWRGSSHD
jgi:hypothetical protein